MYSLLSKVILFIFISTLAKAQDTYYPIELGANFGISVPTTSSNLFYESPEKVMGGISVSYFKTSQKGIISGLNYGKVGHYDEITVPLYYTYRTKTFHSSFNPYRSPLGNSLNFLIPQQVQFYGGLSTGCIFGESRKNIKLNRHLVSSLDFGIKGGYTLGPLRTYIIFGFDYLLTNNYSFRGWSGYSSPNLHFNLMGGVSWSY